MLRRRASFPSPSARLSSGNFKFILINLHHWVCTSREHEIPGKVCEQWMECDRRTEGKCDGRKETLTRFNILNDWLIVCLTVLFGVWELKLDDKRLTQIEGLDPIRTFPELVSGIIPWEIRFYYKSRQEFSLGCFWLLHYAFWAQYRNRAHILGTHICIMTVLFSFMPAQYAFLVCMPMGRHNGFPQFIRIYFPEIISWHTWDS